MTGLHFLNDYTEINKMLYASIKSISTIHLAKWPAKNGEWRVVNRASAPEDRVWPDGLWPPYLMCLARVIMAVLKSSDILKLPYFYSPFCNAHLAAPRTGNLAPACGLRRYLDLGNDPLRQGVYVRNYADQFAVLLQTR